jgi:hypothetical protein
MEERVLILPLEKSTFQNVYISPREIKRNKEILKVESELNTISEISETDKIKAKIFTRELEDLIKKVASKKKELENKDRPIEVIPKGKELLYDYISLAYTQPDNQKLISEILVMILESHNIKSFILSNFSRFSGMFEPIYSGGIKEITKRAFQVHSSNPLIEGKKNTLIVRNINVIRENVFFEKYFKEENLSLCESISFYNFDVFHNPFLLTILNFKNNSQEKVKFDDLKILEDLEALFPILNLNNFKDNEKTIEASDLTNQINIYFKQKLNNSRNNNLYISKVMITNYFSAYDRIKRKNEITSILQNSIEDDDIILESMYNKFFIFSEINYKNEIYESLIKKLGNENEFTLETYKYPDEINNIYLCF